MQIMPAVGKIAIPLLFKFIIWIIHLVPLGFVL